MISKSNIKIKEYAFLHFILLVYSLGGIFSKIASSKVFLSLEFIIFYGLVIITLFIYAILWQQVLKMMPLTTAFLNKSVVVVWGILWGALFFGERIKWNMIVGAFIIILGIIVVVSDNE